ncbi:uncharacterized protein LOC113321518 isoform X2 [Papaver somniferum]|uniref:uncharacterized protein LOC113321518 isoform X2 n=1 Tax=Papaver somniferum TaxID=3469 RepID=UPI000E705E72|nr:uncharacterized protein LOC113321518 isoform X2 [Papaver somniferum]
MSLKIFTLFRLDFGHGVLTPAKHLDLIILEFEDIIKRMSNLMDKNKELEYEEEETQEECLLEWRRCLVFKLVTGRGHAFFILKEMLLKAWKTSGDFSLSDLGNNIYKIRFENLCDMEAVLKSSPWALNNELMVIERCDDDLLPKEYEFKYVWFWIQIHGLPISMLNNKKIYNMAKKFGNPQNITDEDAAKWGKYARIRVRIDITKPLPKEMKVTFASKKIRTNQFRYEKLPKLCYFCGLFGHAMKQCPVLSSSIEKLKLPPKFSVKKWKIQGFLTTLKKLESTSKAEIKFQSRLLLYRKKCVIRRFQIFS